MTGGTLLTEYYQEDQTKENKMEGHGSALEEPLQKGDHFTDLQVNGRIILKWN